MSDRLRWLEALRTDAPAGLVVFLVALPLCLGIALASDAPLVSGLVAGVIGGIVVGGLSGSHPSVSGPAAGLAVVVAAGAQKLGGFDAFLTAVMLAGVLQLGLGLARVGFLANLFPSSVIRGMLAAIGIIVVLKQIPHALGRDTDFEGDESFWMMNGRDNTFTEIAKAVMSATPGVVIVAVTALAILLLWERPAIKNLSVSKVIPGALVAVVASVLINEAFKAFAPGLAIGAEGGHLVQIPVFSFGGELSAIVPRPDLGRIADPKVWIVAMEITAIASLETLLCLEACDRIDPKRRTSPPNQELLAQGVGNFLSGALGGLPITSVVVRSSANVQAGAQTKVSAVFHGVLLLALALSVPFLLNLVPLGALAAVLLLVGYRLARVELFKEMWGRGWDQFLPFIVTVMVTVFSDLLVGVGVGFVVSMICTVFTSIHTAIVVVRERDFALVKFTRDLSFLHKYQLRRALESIPNGVHVIIDGARSTFIDPDVQEQIEAFVASAPQRDQRITARELSRKFRLPENLASSGH